ncbi:MAG: hypothetical protein JKY09_00445 [Crocinitomicaceae bacterium]|nr:hypothetical protein [Crocinitomicaceae bacterium]
MVYIIGFALVLFGWSTLKKAASTSDEITRPRKIANGWFAIIVGISIMVAKLLGKI